MAAISQSERIRRKMHKDLTKARDTGMLDYYDPKIKVYACNIGNPEVVLTQPVTDNEVKVLKRLELLSGDGHGDYGMIARRHLKASVDTMQTLYFKGLVDGRGLPDANGYGNTPDSSIWGITRRGFDVLTKRHKGQGPRVGDSHD